MEPFYYNHMDKERQAVYRAMRQGLLSLADSFQIPRIDGHALSDIFFELRLDHPEIFWVSSFKYRYFADSAFYGAQRSPFCFRTAAFRSQRPPIF